MNVLSHAGFTFRHSEINKNSCVMFVAPSHPQIWFDLVYFQHACGAFTVWTGLCDHLSCEENPGEQIPFAILTFQANWAACPPVRRAGALHWWPLWNAKDGSQVQTPWLFRQTSGFRYDKFDFQRVLTWPCPEMDCRLDAGEKKFNNNFRKSNFL